MTILKYAPKRDGKGFTVFPNALLQDTRLSEEARGLLCRMLSLAPQWQVSKSGTQAISHIGKHKISRLFKEWEELGYAKCDQQKRNKDNKWEIVLWVLTPEPYVFK